MKNVISKINVQDVEYELATTTENITHGEDLTLLSTILDTYILNIDYETLLKFDTTEIVLGSGSTSAKLGVAILG